MSVVTDRLTGFLLGLSRRERWLLALLTLVAVPIGAIYGIALPLAETREAARAAVSEARATELWVADQALVYATLTRETAQTESTVRVTTPVGISGIEASLREAGLRDAASELANAADGGITIRFDEVRFTRLAEWLTTQNDIWGYDLAGFTFERGAREDVVAADLRLELVQ
ncbi:type II secretion system protein GspM [uncultured Roseovarius sp.]|uniref:type II secretion system protein GspM n=1 Tax=uncultured Roseovarius sp. TaxID=293344 RepID=UPI00262C5BAE|nr:type II secretion system protein GspM [uncultured Roseovarius sp.]